MLVRIWCIPSHRTSQISKLTASSQVINLSKQWINAGVFQLQELSGVLLKISIVSKHVLKKIFFPKLGIPRVEPASEGRYLFTLLYGDNGDIAPARGVWVQVVLCWKRKQRFAFAHIVFSTFFFLLICTYQSWALQPSRLRWHPFQSKRRSGKIDKKS